jgi:hypothetical protein
MTRQESINKIKTAFENKQLGFQKGAMSCKYYCAISDSHCAIGVLIGKDQELINESGDIHLPLKDIKESKIELALDRDKKSEMFGLSRNELQSLQELHDNCVGKNLYGDILNQRIEEFKNYLYSLK